MYTIDKTRPYRDFRDQVGNTTSYINAAYVGMEWIALGSGKPPGLKIAWSVPKNPRQEIDQARGVIHSAMLTRVTDALDTYLVALASETWLTMPDSTRDVLRKSVTKPGGVAYSIVERILELGIKLNEDGQLSLALAATLVAWRNQVVHSGRVTNDELRLDRNFVESLSENASLLSSLYGGLDPLLLINHLRRKDFPKRKEIVSLVAATQNLVREIDWRLIRRTIPTQIALEIRAKQAIGSTLSEESDKALVILWNRNSEARLRKLHDILRRNGFSTSSSAHKLYTPKREQALQSVGIETEEPPVHSLSLDFLTKLASLSYDDAQAELQCIDG
ncbi:hypothetical protein KQ910_10985 [Reyranella sp. MMS21-HV4-11]|uniref:Apea-like HEPN domain-containing protein n=1 Tax=Reyranella humidisoli TaxID=2849149 RepID=A0ABS6II71_9HYPH|nr:hypothetical protein [Reyranella sp. MMS21-HV4-11]MBU8874291.1 hypothetical protein [Reyranella sp. MMS21-HV4-11]